MNHLLVSHKKFTFEHDYNRYEIFSFFLSFFLDDHLKYVFTHAERYSFFFLKSYSQFQHVLFPHINFLKSVFELKFIRGDVSSLSSFKYIRMFGSTIVHTSSNTAFFSYKLFRTLNNLRYHV